MARVAGATGAKPDQTCCGKEKWLRSVRAEPLMPSGHEREATGVASEHSYKRRHKNNLLRSTYFLRKSSRQFDRTLPSGKEQESWRSACVVIDRVHRPAQLSCPRKVPPHRYSP